MSLAGPFALQGQHAFDGIRLWESHINAREGIACNTQGQRHVRLVVYDDQSRVRLAQENARRLLEQDRVDILLGPYSSALTIGVAQVAEEHGKLLWNHGGASDKMFSLGHRHVVSTISPASEYFRELPHWVEKNLSGLRRICVLFSSKGTFASQAASEDVNKFETPAF